jgi:hypothetical protein
MDELKLLQLEVNDKYNKILKDLKNAEDRLNYIEDILKI